MASLRSRIVTEIQTRISSLRDEGGNPFLGSVNLAARAPDSVNDCPSVDIIVGEEDRTLRASWMAERNISVIVRVWSDEGWQSLDDLIEKIEDVIRSEPTLSGLVIHIACTNITTDEGWLGMQGFPSMADVRFEAHWEAEET